MTDSRIPDGALTPVGWERLRADRALVCGFGSRRAAPSHDTVVTVRQVHGVRVVDGDALVPGRNDIDADAITVRTAGRVVAVATADCVPVLLVSAGARWAAVAHAGWRGTLGRIVAHAVAAARAQGLAPEDLFAAIGPAIGPCCYEVGDEVAGPFAAEGHAVLRGRAKAHLDLRAANRQVLIDAGVAAEHIQLCGPCTRCAADAYYSYRARPHEGGRQLSWIGWTAR